MISFLISLSINCYAAEGDAEVESSTQNQVQSVEVLPGEIIAAHHEVAPAVVESVSVQEVTRHFRDSQHLLIEACNIKSIERALRSLDKAETALKKAKEILIARIPERDSEVRMKSRLLYKLDLDLGFLNKLRGDLGMAEQDNFDSYLSLRRSLIKDPDQRQNVIKMDQQIIVTLKVRSLGV
jgi:hypothetical protein